MTGSVGFNDFTRVTQHYNQASGGTWDTGDFNYDGSVNSGDFTLMTRTYNTSLGNQAIAAASASASPASSASSAHAPPATAPEKKTSGNHVPVVQVKPAGPTAHLLPAPKQTKKHKR